MNAEIEKSETWQKLKGFTHARIALGNVGNGMPLAEVLNLKLAHAKAKDAIFTELDKELFRNKNSIWKLPFFELKSKIKNRNEYLKRPDLGRLLTDFPNETVFPKSDIVFVICDGLSASAVNRYADKILDLVLPDLQKKYTLAIALVEQGRVAVGDPVAELFNADFAAVFIGERPGLSSPESLGIYTTYKPKSGFTDEKRNCISNIHENGLADHHAALLLNFLINQSYKLKLSGVELKVDLNLLNQ